jgi:hypothetical protein
MNDAPRKVNVEPTAEVIDGMANTVEVYAKELRRIAATLRERGDLESAADALITINNMNGNLRTDLLVVRPLRAMRQTEE